MIHVTFNQTGWLGWCPVMIGAASDEPDGVELEARWAILAPWFKLNLWVLGLLGFLYSTVTGNDAFAAVNVTGDMNPVITHTFWGVDDETT